MLTDRTMSVVVVALAASW